MGCDHVCTAIEAWFCENAIANESKSPKITRPIMKWVEGMLFVRKNWYSVGAIYLGKDVSNIAKNSTCRNSNCPK